ncbi:spore cortex-lytic enzyme [Pumilibacter intestinalis]|uniref:spore cortex-lytic enzyme n=1 Tax=Pumilibacter intestinalis TaxID=2941511 RepID=UPI0020411437|nr:spore cortex-lytic enzyme [Pumilibacter intestinalis]MCI8487473.1 spore cortex-lytic enzyme [Clostridia bacterium]MCX4313985.1 spore cortex-lytic enzyme [Clostridia bacterium]
MNKRRNVCIVFLVLVIALCAFAGATHADAAHIIKGDTKENVRMVQQRLKELGYYKIGVDGIWGAKTLAGVKNFQRAKGLAVDGIVGARTEKALGITLKSSGGNNSGGTTSSADLNLLARCVYGEARGEPYTGQVAVAAVVLNRVRSSKFPNTVSGVIYQAGAFTAVADGQINLSPNQSAYNAARDALNGWDPTNGCLYYYNPATATSKWIWSLKVELKIGRHSFARG